MGVGVRVGGGGGGGNDDELFRAHPCYSVFTVLSWCCSPVSTNDDDDGFSCQVVGRWEGGY